MTSGKHHFAIGLFTLIGLLLLAAACVLFGTGDRFTRKLYFETYFESSVQGLDIGSPVKLRGVQVGSVNEIGFTGTTYGDQVKAEQGVPKSIRPLNYVRVLCSIDLDKHPNMDAKRLTNMIKHGLHTNLALQGITGQVFVNLDFPRRANGIDTPSDTDLTFPWKPDHLYIPSTPTTLQNLLNVAQDIADSLSKSDIPEAVQALTELAHNIDRIATEADIPKLTKTFTELGDSLNAQSKQISEVLTRLNAAKLGDNLQTITDDFAQTSTTIRTELPPLFDSLEATLTRTDALLDQAVATLAELNANVDTQSLSTDLQETLSNLARTSAATEALVQELRQKPSRLLFD